MASQGSYRPVDKFNPLVDELHHRPNYQPQSGFPIGNSASTTLIDDVNAVSALRWAIRIARNLCLSERGLTTTAHSLSTPASPTVRRRDLPPPASQADEEPPVVVVPPDLVRLFFEKDSTVIVCKDMKGWASVDPSAPDAINVQRRFVEEAGRMYARFKDDRSNNADRVHVIFLGVIVAHALQRSVWLQFARYGFAAHDTSIKIRSLDDRVRPAGQGLYHGEGGWLWEQRVLGGLLTLEKMKPAHAAVQGQAAGLWIHAGIERKQKDRRYFPVDYRSVMRLTEENQSGFMNLVLPLLRDNMLSDPRQFSKGEIQHGSDIESDCDEDGVDAEQHAADTDTGPVANDEISVIGEDDSGSVSQQEDDDTSSDWSGSSSGSHVYCGYQHQLRLRDNAST